MSEQKKRKRLSFRDQYETFIKIKGVPKEHIVQKYNQKSLYWNSFHGPDCFDLRITWV